MNGHSINQCPCIHLELNSRDRIVVSTPRCGRGNPGSNPGLGSTPDADMAGLKFLAK